MFFTETRPIARTRAGTRKMFSTCEKLHAQNEYLRYFFPAQMYHAIFCKELKDVYTYTLHYTF